MGNNIEPESGILLADIFSTIPVGVYPIFAILIVLLLLSALVSGSEVAFFSLSPTQLEKLKKKELVPDQYILRLLKNPKSLLATILILNNLVNVGIVTLSTYAMWKIAGKDNQIAILWLTIITTLAIVFFGEILPKVFATQRNLYFARLMAGGLVFTSILLKPISWVLMMFGDVLESRFQRKGYEVSVNELKEAVEMTTEMNTTKEEKDILKGIVNFGTKTVKQIMRSRIDITAFDYEMDFHQLMDQINKSGFSRIPVYTDTIDHIEGLLYVKDLLPHLKKDEYFEWQSLIRKEVFFVPENKKIDELLKDFQEKRVHMAIIVDEYGGTSGLITMEDIIEEIVGEINDEFDNNELAYKKIDEATYTFEGKTSLNDFCKILDIDSTVFEEAKGESESLGGLLLELFSKMPQSGEQIEFGNYVFTAVAVNSKRIKNVRVLIKDRIENVKQLPPPKRIKTIHLTKH